MGGNQRSLGTNSSPPLHDRPKTGIHIPLVPTDTHGFVLTYRTVRVGVEPEDRHGPRTIREWGFTLGEDIA